MAVRSPVAATDEQKTSLKAEAALRIAGPLLLQPVADRTNGTLARLADEIAAKEGIKISRSQLSKVLRKKGDFASGDRGTP